MNKILLMIQIKNPESTFYDEYGSIYVDLEKVALQNVENALIQIQRWAIEFEL